MESLLISAGIIVLCIAAAAGIYAALYGSQRSVEERISDPAVRMRLAFESGDAFDVRSDGAAHQLFRWVAQRLPEPKIDPAQAEKLAHTLMQAGYPGPTAVRHFQLIRLGCALAGAAAGLVAAIVTDSSGARPVLFIVCGAVLGAFLPSYYVSRKAARRQQEIASQLSDALDLLVVCVEAGLGLAEAIKIVGSETERIGQAIGQELAQVSGELNAGVTLGQALRSMADRTSVPDIKPLAATLIQSEQIGAQVGPALRSISDSMRVTRRMRAEEAAQKTTVKILFPLVLFILPAMMAVIVGPAMIEVMRVLNKN
jgi:tight adherence protein C